MSDFKDFMIDQISILKKDGYRIESINASVQKNKIFIDRSDILVESGDLVLREMSNGAEETFEVIDPGFYEEFQGLDAHYQMDVKKLGIPESKEAIQNITYNITGANARINNNSTDNSINFSTQNIEVTEHIEAIRSELHRLVKEEVEKKSANEIVDAIEQQMSSETPSKTVVSILVKALPAVGSISSLGAFLVSLL